MSVLFAHDHKFKLINGDCYSSGNLGDNVLIRYIKIFGNILVIARVNKENKVIKGYSKIENKNVSIIKKNELRYNELYDLVKKSDYVISRLPSVIGSEIAYIAEKTNKPYLIEMVGCPWDGLWNHSLKGKLAALPMMIVTKYLVKNAPYVLYVTNEFLQKRYPTKGVSVGCSDVVLNCTDESVIQKRREKIKNHKGKIILGTAAALNVKYKGQRFVIHALAELKNQGITNYEYQVIGGGDASVLVNEAKRLGVSDMLNVVGQLDHNDVFNWLENVDIYIQPSLQEGLPRAVIEAMSCGVPCMGFCTAGIPELLDKSMVCPKRDSHEIAEKLKNLDKDKMLKLAEYSFNKSKEYDKDVLDKRRNDFYVNFLKA